MHLVETEFKEFNNRFRAFCPYCRQDQWGAVGAPIYKHDCPDAGTLYFLNGYVLVGAPNFLEEEKASTKKHD